MKAVETNFLKFLQGTRQFVIPIYQRTYSWTRQQCEQLWKDIVRTADDEVSGHFVGSVVYVERGLYQVTAVPQLLVIDGQQRLTTLSLLLIALGRALESANGDSEMTRKKLNGYYLINDQETGEKRFKLLLTRAIGKRSLGLSRTANRLRRHPYASRKTLSSLRSKSPSQISPSTSFILEFQSSSLLTSHSTVITTIRS